MSSSRLRFKIVLASVRGAVGFAALAFVAPYAAQSQEVEERFPGVSLSLSYETRGLPTLAVQPFSAPPGGESHAALVEEIVGRDLSYSDRFNVIDALPVALTSDGVDYDLWDEVGATWLVTGRLEGTASNPMLLIELHDVVYREVLERGRFGIPQPGDSGFRMAAHGISDQVVEWAFDEPGMAASRIVFSQRMEDGSQDLWVIDSDGENLRRLTSHRGGEFGVPISMSPDWSPDGTRVVYTSYKDDGLARVYELNLITGEERRVPTPQTGDYISPAYHPNGEWVYFGISGGTGRGIYRYNIVDECCFGAITQSRVEDISPTFSVGGADMAFNSFRLGEAAPQIYVTPSDGSGQASLVSPYVYGTPGYYTSPDWSQYGNRIAYHGRVRQRGAHQILIAELDGRNRVERTFQVTRTGVNEDPSWAPDGRHIVYVGERRFGYGLFVLDIETGSERSLATGIRPNPPSWSQSLAP